MVAGARNTKGSACTTIQLEGIVKKAMQLRIVKIPRPSKL
jgi:hypothetical protein